MEETHKQVIAYLIGEYRKNNGILFGDAHSDWQMAEEFGNMYRSERPFFWDSLWEDCLVLFCQNKWR